MGNRKCVQCYKLKPVDDFIGARGRPVTWCGGCRIRYRGGGVADTRRNGLGRTDGTHRFSFVRSSNNRKLGPIAATMTSAETCPDACELKDRGCFGEFGLLRMHWKEVGENGLELGPFLDRIASLSPGSLARYNVVGDLPGVGNTVNHDAVMLLALAAEGRQVFTYTHKPLDRQTWALLCWARDFGLTVNVSADGVRQLDAFTSAGLVFDGGLPAVVVLPSDAPPALVTPRGTRVIVCPAETKGDVSCSTCGICARPDRKFAIGFRAHGQWAAKVTELVQLRVNGKGNGNGAGGREKGAGSRGGASHR